MSGMGALLELLYPEKCVFCGHILPKGEREICPSCRKSLPYCRDERKCEFVKWVSAPLYYEGRAKDSLRRFKFASRAHYAVCYAGMMAAALDERREEFDVISFVPIHARRKWRRGYDQSAELAKELSRRLGVEMRPLLKKLRNAPPQSRTGDAAARRANISGCFGLRKGASVEGRRILLVDDIFTTGATLSECARVLRMHGAAEVCGAVVACSRAKQPPEPRNSEVT